MSTEPNLTYLNRLFCLIHKFLVIKAFISTYNTHAIKTCAVSTYCIHMRNNGVLIVWGKWILHKCSYCTHFYVNISKLNFAFQNTIDFTSYNLYNKSSKLITLLWHFEHDANWSVKTFPALNLQLCIVWLQT